ncbi:MAG: TrkH family potassium uptake protein [Spirochaetes bacterium]|nr:TrkH family potassium uptake protein [Spirochaetota bacterium]
MIAEKDKKGKGNIFVFIILFLAVFNLFLEHGIEPSRFAKQLIQYLDIGILLLFALDIILNLTQAKIKGEFFKKNFLDIIIIAALIGFFIYNRYISFLLHTNQLQSLSKNVIIFRNIFILLKVFSRMKKLNYFLKSISSHPAQTILFSFMIVILAGTILLIMPFSTADGSRLGILNALFTSTSAVCVTGLIVVDTATRFSLYGQIIIMSLIQTGGLGIMILSYFSGLIIGTKFSIEDKILMSYMLNEQDMKNISRAILNIILATFLIEIIGALVLFTVFKGWFGLSWKSVLFSAFHSISAFCNAGFALFTDSFEQFKSNITLNMTITLLIIMGGLSFIVINNLFRYVKNVVKRKIFEKRESIVKISLNTRLVLIITAILIIIGTLILYAFEHKANLIRYDLVTQYLVAFFQSVTLRTAGFNTIDFSHLQIYSYLVMIVFMFIGAASGSTAGGIKVNTLSVIFSYIKSLIKGEEDIVIFKQSIAKDLVNKAFLIIILFISSIFLGTLILTITENFQLIQILFETVSAIGTVGLSTGITGQLSVIGKITIIMLMFIGRLGPLTIVAAISKRGKKFQIKFPEGNINIG